MNENKHVIMTLNGYKEVIEENTKENYPENVCVIRWSLSMDEGGIIKLFSRDCPNTKLKK